MLGAYSTYRYTVTTRMTPALRRVSTRAIFNISLTVRDNVTKTSVHKRQLVKRKESQKSGIQTNAVR